MMHICVMSSHKNLYGHLILGVNTLYRCFCLSKLFSMVGKGLNQGALSGLGMSLARVRVKTHYTPYSAQVCTELHLQVGGEVAPFVSLYILTINVYLNEYPIYLLYLFSPCT